MTFLLLLSIPFFIALGFFIFAKHKVTWHEFVAHVGISVVVAGMSMGLMYCANTHDTEVWNGHVTKKESQKVSCSHDYCCRRCTRQVCSGTGKDRHCHTETYCCQTCYEHPYDVSWYYWTTDNGQDSVSRVDRQGLQEPPRWTQVVVGEPSSSTRSFTNYIKAAPDTLFQYQGLVEKYQGYLPKYPNDVYDLYRLDRVILVNGAFVPDHRAWNYALSEVNDHVGFSKESNVVLVLVKDLSEEYFNALKQHWLGGKQNDTIVVVGVDGTQIRWARVMSWSKTDLLNVKMRDALLEIGTLDDRARVMGVIESNIKQYFDRRPMDDFEYLKSSITPTTGQLIFAMIINLLLSVGCGIFFMHNDFNEGDRL
jgi:hypothetical protein